MYCTYYSCNNGVARFPNLSICIFCLISTSYYLDPFSFEIFIYWESIKTNIFSLSGLLIGCCYHTRKQHVQRFILVICRIIFVSFFKKTSQYIFHYFSLYSCREAATKGVLCKKVFSEISQNSQENTCARVSFLINFFIRKETLAQVFSCEFCEISKNTFFTEHLWTTASSCRSFVAYLEFQFWYIKIHGPWSPAKFEILLVKLFSLKQKQIKYIQLL